jgi:diguanylate cyclase (GGDEF)-like protein
MSFGKAVSLHKQAIAPHAKRIIALRESASQLLPAPSVLSVLRAHIDEFSGEQSPQRIAELLLASALDCITVTLPPEAHAGLTGMVTLASTGAIYTVQAGIPPHDKSVGRKIHGPLRPAVQHVIRTHAPLTTRDQVHLPLLWDDRMHGVLSLETPELHPIALDALSILVAQAVSGLECAANYELAAVDATTRAFTRTFVLQRLYECLKGAYRNGTDLTILMMDLDNFKRINDTYGHLVGDRVLHAAGTLFHRGLRETDVLGRYGGDEFIILLPNTPIAGGAEVARRLLFLVRDFCLDIGEDEITLGVSIGIGGIGSNEPPSPHARRPSHEAFQKAMERLIAQADGFMYRAKHAASIHYAGGLPLSWGNVIGEID